MGGVEMSNLIHINKDYATWIGELKLRIRQSQIKAAVKVNTELLQLYWQLGSDIVEKQKNTKWGDGFLKQLSQDLSAEFPEMIGKCQLIFYTQTKCDRHAYAGESEETHE